MRPYSVILLIPSLIDFVLAAPVQVQEKRQSYIDVKHKPHEATTMLGRGGTDEVEKLMDELFGSSGKLAESSDAHASSSSALQEPDHWSTNVAQAPAPKPASSTANLGQSMEPPSLSSAQGGQWWDPQGDFEWMYKNKGDEPAESHEPLLYDNPLRSESGADHEVTGPPKPPSISYSDTSHWTTFEDSPPPKPPSTSYSDLNHWTTFEDSPAPKPAPQK